MDHHFTLPVEPEDLRTLRRKLALLSTNLGERGATARNTPTEIGDAWTGQAATTIKEAMYALGTVMDRLAGELATISDAAGSLAAGYEAAQDRVRELNQRWEHAEQEYAATAHDPELAESVQATRDAEQQALATEFGELREGLEQRTRSFGLLLAEHTPRHAVEAAVAFSRPH